MAKEFQQTNKKESESMQDIDQTQIKAFSDAIDVERMANIHGAEPLLFAIGMLGASIAYLVKTGGRGVAINALKQNIKDVRSGKYSPSALDQRSRQFDRRLSENRK